jgi:predicted membrane protein
MSLAMNDSGRFLWGIILIVLGVIFLLDYAGAIEFGPFVRMWWPALLIFWGIYLIRRRFSSPVAAEEPLIAHTVVGDKKEQLASDRIEQSNVFGNVELNVMSQNFKGGAVSTVFGDCRIDLSRTTLAVGENRLSVSGVFGTIVLTLPPGAAFSLSANAFLGSVRVQANQQSGFAPAVVLESPDYAGASKKLRLHLSQVFGELEVRQ